MLRWMRRVVGWTYRRARAMMRQLPGVAYLLGWPNSLCSLPNGYCARRFGYMLIFKDSRIYLKQHLIYLLEGTGDT